MLDRDRYDMNQSETRNLVLFIVYLQLWLSDYCRRGGESGLLRMHHRWAIVSTLATLEIIGVVIFDSFLWNRMERLAHLVAHEDREEAEE